MGYVLGVDGGTESLRAHVFDLDGRSLGSGATPYETKFPMPGRAEQEPEDWWRALGASVHGALADAEVAAGDVLALALDTTCCSVVALDAQHLPVRPALIWMDVRASAETEMARATGDAALRVNGGGSGPVSAEWMIPKALWIKRNEPELYARVATVCEYQDYLNLRLTGRRVASASNASVRWHWQSRHGGWPTTLLAALDLGDLHGKWPAEVLPTGAPIGPLTAEAAAHLGLPQRTLVVQGGSDAFIGMIGLGVAKPGQLAMITGSSHLHLGITAEPVHAPGVWGTYSDAAYAGREVIEGGQTSTGSIIAWYRRLLGEGGDLVQLNAEAAKLTPGSDGLLVLDHFQGNRTPHTDPLSRGAMIGLSLGHTRAHLFRAIIEGICFGTRAVLDAMRAAGFAVDEMTVGGGASRSPLWMQIHADTAGVPVRLPSFLDAPALGSAILAAVGAGRFSTVDDGIAAMVRFDRVVEPDPKATATYDALYQDYTRLYPALRELRHG